MNMELLFILGAVLMLSVGVNAQKAGAQEPQEFKKRITKTVSARYLLYLPKDYDQEKSKRFPLMVFLHGAGERGSDLNKVKAHGPPKLVDQGKEMPFIIVSPQCPEDEWWSVDTLNTLLDEIIKKYRVDEDRIYLTGLSMGGYGTWNWAAEHPERFAAIAPICGGGRPRMADKIKILPVWVFHGAKDDIVPLQESQQMVDALKKQNADVKFTIYPEAGHDSWTETYNNQELYDWFLQHTRKKSK